MSISKWAVKTAVAAAMSVAVLGAQAGTLTFEGWRYGEPNRVDVISTTAGLYDGGAGAFRSRLAGAAFGLDSDILESYCVELTQSMQFGHSYGDYVAFEALDYFGAPKADRLSRLLSYVVGNDLFGPASPAMRVDLTASVQLAVWNIVYDEDTTLAGGSLRDTSPSAAAATSLLDASANWINRLDLFVLQSNRQQDQLVWRSRAIPDDRAQPVPEPGSLALAALALGGLAAARRRRT